VRSIDVSAIATISALLLAALPAIGAEQDPRQLQAEEDARSPEGSQSPRSSRLRFRSGGPVCMCATNGLSEAEIEAAERKRKKAKADQ
jgi:hypothetical protein